MLTLWHHRPHSFIYPVTAMKRLNLFSSSISRRVFATALSVCVAVLLATPASAQEAQIGEPAPTFSLQSASGETVNLSDFEGQYVVLEWLNFGCPFVGKHYDSGNMQSLQETYREKGVAWLSIVSSAKGEQGYYPPEQMVEQKKKHNGEMTAILLDSSGEVGRTYGATVTPHMYVINPEGNLIYKGGIDDRPTTDVEDVDGATNYVRAALNQAMNGEEVAVKRAQPYGCSVKYASK